MIRDEVGRPVTFCVFDMGCILNGGWALCGGRVWDLDEGWDWDVVYIVGEILSGYYFLGDVCVVDVLCFYGKHYALGCRSVGRMEYCLVVWVGCMYVCCF